jgi:1,4-alpha-glucan branching enzyme
VWADLAARGVIELLGGPATHPYLPLMADERLLRAQLETGLAHHARWAGARPTGLWAPEMGYRPRGPVADATAEPQAVDRYGTPTLPRLPGELPGLEELYAELGIDHFLVDAATLVRAAGGAERDWTRRPEVPDPEAGDPYEVVHDGVRVGDTDVVAYARDLSVAYHVWSPTAGYPGDAWYRDFHAVGTFGVHRSWRVTDRELPPTAKATYEPDRAAAAVTRDAEHFHGVLREVLDPRPSALVVAAYDTELFGHWWFEGPAWLDAVLRRIADDPRLVTTTLASRRSRRPPTRRLDLPESSWGYAKGHASWVTDDTRPLWAGLRRAESLAREAASSGRLTAAAEAQVARELAQLMCSDWPFMVTRGNAAEYALGRARDHLARLEELCAGTDEARVAELARRVPAPSDPAPMVAALRARAGG